MRLSRSADYALRAMQYLAGLSEGEVTSGAMIAEETGVGEAFLQKVMRLLVRSRLVRAQSGVGGGFKLNLPPEQISMLRVIEAVDGPLDLGTCLEDDYQNCGRKAWCSVHAVISGIHRHTLHVLGGTSIARLKRDSDTRQDFVRSISQRSA
jgi:Rrf2 family protein